MDVSGAEQGAAKIHSLLGGLGGAFRALLPAISIGAAVAGAFVTIRGAIQGAAEERLGIEQLNTAIAQTGAGYEESTARIERYLTVARQRYALDDDVGRKVLTSLTMQTQDYDQALALLPLTLNLARGRHMDLASAAELVGRVYEGNVGMLTRYGIVLEKGATATEALAILNQRFAGQAEAYARSSIGQWDRLTMTLGEFGETAGSVADSPLARLYGGLADLAESALPYVQYASELATEALAGLGDIAADAVRWGANVIAQFAQGMGLEIPSIVSVLNQIAHTIESWLAPGSPPRLLPHLDDWGREAGQTYLDSFSSADVAGAFQPIAAMSEMAFGKVIDGAGVAGEVTGKWLQIESRAVWVYVQQQGAKREARNRDWQEQLDKAKREEDQRRKEAEMEAKRIHDSKLRWELATTDIAGGIALWQRELAETTEGSSEYYDILTNIVSMEKRLAEEAKKGAGGGGAGGAAGRLKPLEIPQLIMPSIHWEDVIEKGAMGIPDKIPGLKTKLLEVGKKIGKAIGEGITIGIPALLGEVDWSKVLFTTIEAQQATVVPLNNLAAALERLGKALFPETMEWGGKSILMDEAWAEDRRVKAERWASVITTLADAINWLAQALNSLSKEKFVGPGGVSREEWFGKHPLKEGIQIPVTVASPTSQEVTEEVTPSITAGLGAAITQSAMGNLETMRAAGKTFGEQFADGVSSKESLGNISAATNTVGETMRSILQKKLSNIEVEIKAKVNYHDTGAGAVEGAVSGADFVTRGPQLLLVGEGDRPERVQVTPLPTSRTHGNIIFNIQGRNADEISRAVVARLREVGI
jgi:hypothetical protein